jgi:alanine racemase
MVDITDIPDVTPGTEATLIGRSGECCQTAFELAESLGTISYELLCGINKRVPRKIKHHGNTIELLQYIV